MTNLSLVVTVWVNLVTNPAPVGVTTNGQNFYQVASVSTVQQYLPDGAYLNCSAMTHHSWVTNPAPLSKTFPLPPTERVRLKGGPQGVDSPNRSPRSILVPPGGQSASIANGGPDLSNWSLMFQTRFQTQTNFIYGLESSHDFINWTLLPPEIDGTGQDDFFFDEPFTNQMRVYRVAARPGSLPP